MSSERPEAADPAVNGGDARMSQTPDTQPDPDPPGTSQPPPADVTDADAKPADERSEVARLRDQLLRTLADFDNYRKRTRRELEDASRRGRGAAIKDLLPVFDNLERAASHASDTAEAKSLADGLRIVLKQFVDTLDRLGVKRVATVGLPFDPSVHEAIQHMSSNEHPPGVVMAEVQPGYINGSELLRAAMVVVSKGPEGN